ncbi:MAG: rRNA pseudouridine synthase, partial [Xanthomonadales bacterium]|nr:rRNA pseudouridine synthase [Xanthomonadales bacterium]
MALQRAARAAPLVNPLVRRPPPDRRSGPHRVQPGSAPRIGLARRLSKLGICSRSEAERRIRAGRVTVGNRVVTDPEFPTTEGGPPMAVDGVPVGSAERVYLMLNKPRGLTTTTADERGRETVYRCLDDPSLPWVAPVGRLDRASEGLLLFSNDPEWAAAISASHGISKTYRVRIDRIAQPALIESMRGGIRDRDELLKIVSGRVLSESAGQQRWIEV